LALNITVKPFRVKEQILYMQPFTNQFLCSNIIEGVSPHSQKTRCKSDKTRNLKKEI